MSIFFLSPMQRFNTTTSACASCKHQRKKCTDKCILAPFFPVEKTREFQAVHKVFGVSNVTKIILSLHREEDRKLAVESLVWEAMCRQQDPVLGPYAEYRRVREELSLYKSHYHRQQQIQRPMTLHHQVYKSQPASQGIMTNMMNNNSNYPFGYPSFNNIQETEKLMNDVNSSVIRPLQQQSLNPSTFNQQLFETGQYNPVMDSKSMDSSTLWDASS